MVEIGDIVARNGDRYVVAELMGNAHGGQDARLVRKRSASLPNKLASLVVDIAGLEVVEAPVFEPGERVRIARESGTVQSTSDGHVLCSWTSASIP